jgi:beta-galactosidase
VHIIGHWTYPAGTKKTIYVVSNRERVELFVNGKSLGFGKLSPNGPYIFTFKDVAWEPGEIKAVAIADGKIAATHSLRTAGPAVALRLTPITNPNGGLRADGSDILLVDVEAVDAKGERCPTFQQRVDFQTRGAGIWRGGYNSGKTNSINNPFLDLECGINRVAIRATRSAGKISVKATCPGLKSATLTLKSGPLTVRDGFAVDLPTMPAVSLPAARPAITSAWDQPQFREQKIGHTGKFITEFSYSGPTATVHVAADAQDGKKAFADRDLTFSDLPAALRGADYVQASAADARYNAVDLMEIAVKGGSTVTVAHDERLALPEWLSRQFKPVEGSLTINGRTLKLFQHTVSNDESLTLGTNTENANAPADSSMYIVFVAGH